MVNARPNSEMVGVVVAQRVKVPRFDPVNEARVRTDELRRTHRHLLLRCANALRRSVMSGASLRDEGDAQNTIYRHSRTLAVKACVTHERTRLKCATRSLEDIPESLHGYDFRDFICIARLGGSERVNNLYWKMIGDCNYRHKLPSLTPGLVQKNNELRRVQMTCKYFVFPLLHSTSMA
jgi:hypothetical protein